MSDASPETTRKPRPTLSGAELESLRAQLAQATARMAEEEEGWTETVHELGATIQRITDRCVVTTNALAAAESTVAKLRADVELAAAECERKAARFRAVVAKTPLEHTIRQEIAMGWVDAARWLRKAATPEPTPLLTGEPHV